MLTATMPSAVAAEIAIFKLRWLNFIFILFSFFLRSSFLQWIGATIHSRLFISVSAVSQLEVVG